MRPTLAELIELRLRRREVLGLAALAAVVPRGARAEAPAWTEASPTIRRELSLASGHRAQVLLRWGDAVLPDAPPFSPRAQTARAGEQQLGYNCDHLQFFPLPRNSGRSERGLLVINHEYTDARTMLPHCSVVRGQLALTEAEVAVEQAAHGLSVVEVALRAEGWAPVLGALNRRITARTPHTLTGPAAGHERLRTAEDPSGLTVLGTVANCAGGRTPWGTYLAAEENFHQYFSGPPLTEGREAEAHARYRVGADVHYHSWSRWHSRFDARQSPREPNRFGWVVEVDPFAPGSPPVKRTALGRNFHECATVALGTSGEVVVYSGDDAAFEYLYKYVSRERWQPGQSGGTLLDDGTLFVARLEADGRVVWLPLVHGVGPLDAKAGFDSQADVLIEARRAADLMGATPLDRPEDMDVDPRTGAVFVALSKNDLRTEDRCDASCPRGPNRGGHILVLRPPQGDHAAREARWEILLMGGHPDEDGEYTAVGRPSEAGWVSNPDNLAIDPSGRLWIATDGQGSRGRADGLHVLVPGQGLRRLLSAPTSAEVTGPVFTPDGATLFVSIQHPGEGSAFEAPSTRWPDFRSDLPPRPSVVAIRRDDGGPVGG